MRRTFGAMAARSWPRSRFVTTAFVTSSSAPQELVANLREALFAVAHAPEWADASAGLMLRDIVPIEPANYAVQLRYEQKAKGLGYPELA